MGFNLKNIENVILLETNFIKNKKAQHNVGLFVQ